jgi:thioredoxin 1
MVAMIGGMREVTDATFADEVLAAGAPVVVDFWAPWCGPCKAIEPALDELAETTDNVEFVKLDIDENPRTADAYGVLSLPTVMLFAGGELRETVYGARPKKHFEKTFSPYF